VILVFGKAAIGRTESFPDSSMEQWFNPYHSDSRAKYIQDTIQDCEIMLYGRVTYEMLYPYWSSFKDNAMGVAAKLNRGKKLVISKTLTEAKWENSLIIKDNLVETINALKKEAGGHILVQGSGSLVRTLLSAGLVDELKLLANPHIAGTGDRLFSESVTISLELKKMRQLDKGVVALSYKPAIKCLKQRAADYWWLTANQNDLPPN
jgi:dihydrofolate reductase